MSLLKRQGTLEAKIIGDSRIIIVAMNSGNELKNRMLNLFLRKEQSLLLSLQGPSFYMSLNLSIG